MLLNPTPSWRRTVTASLVTLALSFNLLTGWAWSAPATVPDIYHTTLASGQEIYVQEIRTQPIVTIDTWVNTGSAQEDSTNNGVSHFLEHLLFKGTPQYKVGEIDRILESRGAQFNAATSKDFTHYHITTASPYFEEALRLHADMLLNANIPQPELDRERKVVQEEINRSLDNPGRKAYLALAQMMYGSHPYALDTLGPKTVIQNLPRTDIMDYYQRWYQPENFKTIIAGDVDTQAAVDKVNAAFTEAFGKQRRPEARDPNLYPVQPLQQAKSTILTDPNISVAHMMMGFHAPSIQNRQDNYALDVAAIILGQGASSRLYQAVKEDRQLVNSISAGNGTSQQSGMFYIGAEIKPESRAEAKKAILAEINRFKQEGPTAEELEKAKTQVIKDFAFLNESTEGVAESIGYNVTIGTLEDYTQYVNNLKKITAEDVKRAVNEYVDFNKAAMVEVIPPGKAANQAAQAQENVNLLQTAARSVPTGVAAKTQAPKVANQPQVQEVRLPSGATLLMKQAPSTQTVAFSIFAKGGRLAQPKPGVASLASRVLMKGTKNRSAKQLMEELERLGLNLGASSDEDYMQISGSSLSEDLDPLLSILQDVMLNPTFPQDEVDKERSDMLQDIMTSRDTPSGLLFENLTETLYPKHPYGDVGERLEAALPTVQRDELVQYYQNQIRPENLVISVVGNFNPSQVQARLNEILGGLPKAPAVVKFEDVPPLFKTEIVEAQKPELAATWVAYGWLAPNISSNRDFVTLKVINTLLGSGLSSRLFVELREKQGLAYHVSSMFPSKMKKSNFILYIGTDPANRETVQKGFDTEIQRLMTQPISADELERVKSKLIGQFALAHESNAAQANYLGLYETLGVGHQFDTLYPQLIRQVTAEDIQRVAKQVFTSPKVVAIVSPQSVRGKLETPDEN